MISGEGVKCTNVSPDPDDEDSNGVISEQPHATARSRGVTSAKSDAAPLKSPSTPMWN